MTAQASHNIYSTVDVYFISIIIIYKVTLTKSSGEPYHISSKRYIRHIWAVKEF